MLFPYNPVKSHRRCNPVIRQQQQGIVIIVALFIVALVAAMSYIMMSRLERDTRRTTLLLQTAQAQLYAQGSIAWAMAQLVNNWDLQKRDQVIDKIPIQSPVNNMNGYKIRSTIYDLQARFNINNLIANEAQADFKRLVQFVAPDLNEEKLSELISAIYEWINPIVQETDYARYYLQLPIPYRSAHRPMVSITELRLVKGMTAKLYALLEPYLVALPTIPVPPINIQTAPAAVLLTLSPAMTPEISKNLVKLRETQTFLDPSVFLSLDVVKNLEIKPDKVTAASTYFLIETEVNNEDQRILIYTLIERARSTKDNRAAVTILAQSKGVW